MTSTMELFKPNDEQYLCITKVTKFIEEHITYSKLLINGSAGTGKTTIIISSIISILLKQIIDNLDLVNDLVKKNIKDSKSHIYVKPKWEKLPLNNFIISAPTNKAKDVLVTKYNIYIENELQHRIASFVTLNLITSKVIIQIINSKITFLTVSQVLSIGCVINEMGQEEFTKGNDKKIIEKYNKIYMNTSIIVDECSMIDKNTSKLLELIKCPLIYIGDFCQLPPVNEDLSVVFTNIENSTDINTSSITLKIVERCKNNITLIANQLRDTIYDTSQNFNLLKHTAVDLIIYDKKFSIWLASYIDDIKQKQIELYKSEIEIVTTTTNTPNTVIKKQQKNDTMALGWTNKCCLYLNKKIRSLLFSEIQNIEKQYIIKGDKLIIKTPYYKYDNHIHSSNIVYVSKFDIKKYKPISFSEWCDVIIKLNEIENILNKTQPTQEPSLDIASGISSILDDTPLALALPMQTPHIETLQDKKQNSIHSNGSIGKSSKNLTLLNYFNKNTRDTKDTKDTKDTSTNLESIPKTKTKSNEDIDKTVDNAKLILYRKLFYTEHILQTIISSDTYIFTDELSLNYNLIVTGYDLHTIKNLPSIGMRVNAYTKWHNTMSCKLFGIPNDKISCKKCAFFVNKFSNEFKTQKCQSNFIDDFATATHNLEFELYLCELTSFNSNGKCVSKNIPILDMSKQSNIESLDSIKNIIKNSYEVKLMLSKIDEKQLKLINKSLGEDGETVDKNIKYITLSQMFGHYMSHVITSSYLEVDYGYASTVHKSQGSTYDDVYIEYSNILSNLKNNERNKLLYTAITRCVNKLHIYY